MRPFSAFLLMVLNDQALRDELLGQPDLPALIAAVIKRAHERGLELSEDELHSVVRANHRTWLERYVAG